jgi:hypothetical protein
MGEQIYFGTDEPAEVFAAAAGWWDKLWPRGSDESRTLAIEMVERLASNGSPLGVALQQLLRYWGIGMRMDKDSAVAELVALAADGNKLARSFMARRLWRGDDPRVPVDLERAERLFMKLEGGFMIRTDLALMRSRDDRDLARALLRGGIEEGGSNGEDIRALAGFLLLFGRGVAVDRVRAARLFRWPDPKWGVFRELTACAHFCGWLGSVRLHEAHSVLRRGVIEGPEFATFRFLLNGIDPVTSFDMPGTRESFLEATGSAARLAELRDEATFRREVSAFLDWCSSAMVEGPQLTRLRRIVGSGALSVVCRCLLQAVFGPECVVVYECVCAIMRGMSPVVARLIAREIEPVVRLVCLLQQAILELQQPEPDPIFRVIEGVEAEAIGQYQAAGPLKITWRAFAAATRSREAALTRASASGGIIFEIHARKAACADDGRLRVLPAGSHFLVRHVATLPCDGPRVSQVVLDRLDSV